MGKASSSKKVARAAGTGGGRTNRGRTPWMYYGAILAVIILGTAAVVTSRNHRLKTISASGLTPPRVGQDHWHVAYGIDICGKFQPAITNQTDPVGVHTHGDSVIHVHPFVDSAAGKNATLGKFASTVKMTLNSGELKVPGGKDYRDGDSCEGKPGRVQVQLFSSVTDKVGTLWPGDPRDVPLQDQHMLTIAFLPQGATIPPPPAQAIFNLQHLNDVATPTTTTTTPGATASTTVPVSTAPTTTAPASTPSTTAKK
jgi:hypothetical protein